MLAPRALRAVAGRLLGEPIEDAEILRALDPLELDAKARFAEAPYAESVREAFRMAGQPYDRAWLAQVFWRES